MTDTLRQPPTVELEGVRLRPLRASDATALHDYLRDPAVTERTSYPEVSPALVEAIIERAMHRWATGDLGKWGITFSDDDRLIGTCGFNEWSAAHRWAEVAFELARPHWGKGLMRMTVAAVIEWTYRQDLVDRLQAFVRIDNERSARLLERNGFVREGCLRRYRICRGQAYDFDLFGLLRSDWDARTSPSS